ncbi:hypothetical protein MAPG_00292 [Magnaporthiopsis poae ATCC 64411]|uniref:Uncharacterized protein n=1 Tax=Magnaporthiopsis poae (strain ATCC 64411 / 73-15) TaxID=644358 RepID=A0A0C4DKL5_MAGP6|nr:hypothetical protein MAPG_00292 [Magnaporthiopsis poae ATCC 64411]
MGLVSARQCDTAADESSAGQRLQAVRSASSSYQSETSRDSPELPSVPSPSTRHRWFLSLRRFAKPGSQLSSLFRSSSSSAACRPGREGTYSDECARAETDTVTTAESLRDGPEVVPLEKVQARHQHEAQQIESRASGLDTPSTSAVEDVFTAAARERPVPSIHDSIFAGLKDAISLPGSGLSTLSEVSITSIRCHPRQSGDLMAGEPMALPGAKHAAVTSQKHSSGAGSPSSPRVRHHRSHQAALRGGGWAQKLKDKFKGSKLARYYRRKLRRETSPDLTTGGTTLWMQTTSDGPGPHGNQTPTVVPAQTRSPLSSTRNSGEEIQQPPFSGNEASVQRGPSAKEEEKQARDGTQISTESLQIAEENPEDVAAPTEADPQAAEIPNPPQGALPDVQAQSELPVEGHTEIAPLSPVESWAEADTQDPPPPEPIQTLSDVIRMLGQTPEQAFQEPAEEEDLHLPLVSPHPAGALPIPFTLGQAPSVASTVSTADNGPHGRSSSEQMHGSPSGTISWTESEDAVEDPQDAVETPQDADDDSQDADEDADEDPEDASEYALAA